MQLVVNVRSLLVGVGLGVEITVVAVLIVTVVSTPDVGYMDSPGGVALGEQVLVVMETIGTLEGKTVVVLVVVVDVTLSVVYVVSPGG